MVDVGEYDGVPRAASQRTGFEGVEVVGVELCNASVLFRFLIYYCYLRSHAAREYIDPVCSVFRSSDLLFSLRSEYLIIYSVSYST